MLVDDSSDLQSKKGQKTITSTKKKKKVASLITTDMVTVLTGSCHGCYGRSDQRWEKIMEILFK